MSKRAKEDQLFERVKEKSGFALMRLGSICERSRDLDISITEIRIKLDGSVYDNVLLIVKAETPEGNIIAFHGGEDLASVVIGLVNRLDNGSIKWKEDKPYDERK
jgi:hypothetical protein